MDSKRMDSALEFVGQEIVDQTMPRNAGLPFESIRYDMNPEVRFFAALMAGVAGMLIGFV